jgi:hypothetical protein
MGVPDNEKLFPIKEQVKLETATERMPAMEIQCPFKILRQGRISPEPE